MIRFEHVSKQYNRNGVETVALNDIELTIDKGDVYGIIGYSGAGKSTLVRIINYLEKPTQGTVSIQQQPLNTLSPPALRRIRQKIGMIFQHFNLLESKTVFDNIAMPLRLQNLSSQEIAQRVNQLLDFVGLTEKASSYPKALSGGQKQRIGIARALANNPDILLCDEATSALDPETTKSILALLKKINEQYRITIVVITHEMNVIQTICNKVAVMERGQIIEKGSVLEIFGHPQHKTTQNFVHSVINDHIPPGVIENLHRVNGIETLSRLFKLEFLGLSASQPVINALILQGKVVVNILFAHMSEVQKTVLGSMFIELKGDDDNINQSIVYLRNNSVQVTEVKQFEGDL